MKNVFIVMILILGLTGFALGQTGDRLTDKETKELIQKIEEGRDEFEDELDDDLKDAVYRSSEREVNIKEYLDDFEEKVKRLNERFTKEYSASSEAAAVLKQASDIDKFISNHPGTKGASEWERFAVDLRALAGAYRTSFPVVDGAAVRRINDHEAGQTADLIAKQTDEIKKQIGKDKTLSKEVKESYKEDLEGLKEQAKDLKSRISDSKPATAEARRLMKSAAAIGESLKSLNAPGVGSAWNGVQSSLTKLEAAFGM